MTEPLCPKCGSSMVLRTARSGRNAGGKFWGCSRYPRCKSTIDYGQSGGGVNGTGAGQNGVEALSLPRILVARSLIQGYQSKFFESVAVTQSLREELTDSLVSDYHLRAVSQWRVDFPPTQKLPNWTKTERQILAVAEKLLTRGRLTLCSPFIETKLQSVFGQIVAQASEFENCMLTNSNISDGHCWLDSPAEQLFYNDVLPKVLGSGFSRWVLPQVEIASLVPDSSQEIQGRVDFLICYPSIHPVIVEIEGSQHLQHESSDNERTELLQKHGYKVITIAAHEIESKKDEIIANLKEILNTADKLIVTEPSVVKQLYSIKRCHQIELVILQAIQSGFLSLSKIDSWHVTVSAGHIFLEQEQDAIIDVAIDDIRQLLKNLFNLYEYTAVNSDDEDNHIHIAFDNQMSAPSTFLVQDIMVPFHIANTAFSSEPAELIEPDKTVLKFFLDYVFRKPVFWEGQADAITRTLEGKDSIILLPTGAGKSIAFQLASLLLPGRTVVIDPIISLMDDQIDNLESLGIDRCIAITSQISDPEDKTRVLNLFGQGEYLFAYVAPERFQTTDFRKSLRALTVHTPIAVIAIDEAHCISEWGHDFRTAYLNIGRISRQYCVSDGHVPPLLALTGTASRAVLKDIQRELQIEEFDAIITPTSFDRPELKFKVISSPSNEKTARLLGLLGQKLPNEFSVSRGSFYQPNGKTTYSGLIFCPHVNGEFGVVEQDKNIRESLGIQTAIYSGKEPKYHSGDWNALKQATAHKFKHNQIPVMVCTKAFGMGIDKPNIRFTVHYGIPNSIESFYQEAGRAGRDRNTAFCYILVSDDYPDRSKKLLDPNTPTEEIAQTINTLSWQDNDDITRSLYFQIKAFPGISEEVSNVRTVLTRLQELFKQKIVSLAFGSLDRAVAEKCLHRLVVLGIVSDYTIEYSKKEFTVLLSGATKEDIINTYAKYVEGYLIGREKVEVAKAQKLSDLPHEQFVLGMCNLLLSFIYEVIEKGRRRALNEMLMAATVSPSDQGIRNRILLYLEATAYSEILEQVIAGQDGGIEKTSQIIELIRSPNEAAELRGQVARYLESYPDHPGLLMLRALSEALSRDQVSETVKQNFLAAVNSASNNYRVQKDVLFNFIVWVIKHISGRDTYLAEDLQLMVLHKFPDRELAMKLISNLNIGAANNAAWLLIDLIVQRTLDLIKK